MTLEYLTPLLVDIPVPQGDPRIWATPTLAVAFRPATIAAFASSSPHPMLIVVSRQDFAEQFQAALTTFLPASRRPLLWDSADPLPYEQLPHDIDLTSHRIALLSHLLEDQHSPPVIVTTPRALMSLIRTPESFQRDTLVTSVGDQIQDQKFLKSLVNSGYRMEPVADMPGTIAHRGGIIDVFSPGQLSPVRLELFGDTVESIRTFDPETQRSIDHLEQSKILPPLEFDLCFRDEGLEQLRRLNLETLRPEVLEEWIVLFQNIELGSIPEAVDLLASEFPGNDSTLLSYLPTTTQIVLFDTDAIILEAEQIELRAHEIQKSLFEAGEIPEGITRPYRCWREIAEQIDGFERWEIGSAGAGDVELLPFSQVFERAPVFAGRFDDITREIHRLQRSGWRTVLATEQSERVKDILSESDIYPRIAKSNSVSASEPPPPGAVDVVHETLATGFSLPSAKLQVLTDFELFGIRKNLRRATRRSVPSRQRRQEFAPNGYVVHIEHGIGIYRGLVSLEIEGVDREYLQVDYAANDRLYVPVDQSDRLTAYKAPSGAPTITRLSSSEWNRIKTNVRNAVRELAFDLLQLYADREVASGHRYPPDTPWDAELAESFPYRETVDQRSAISAVKLDLETARPMDRLICGDVGYGKTEVALRAAFKVVNDGRQVAVLVPTTVLALQHYENFRERLAAFPVNVEMLSRLRTKSEQRKILAELENGSIDIVIGTHRILQRDLKFKSLGLLVVDEEQRFGVLHKEQIKRLRSNIDVLTMTATPIPRTLYMALTEMRDLSLISTPPRDRVPIRTFVTARDNSVIREAVLREMSRGGQVFVVHNRVQSIYNIASEIRQQIPEARIAVGHGQMNEKELESVILAFIQHQYDVLICTTIIESGVDIPNANTIIIDNAHALGLTQLYQLRGRVGRGTHRAYAYLLYPPHIPLSPVSRQRLAAIQEATELGAGFQIAMRDMEIRGVGNVLGPQQSGHIGAIGLDLYTRMLATAVEEARTGTPILEPEEIQFDIALDARIPTEYIKDESVRLAAYQSIASAKNNADLVDIDNEFRDRFGPYPEEVKRLFDLVRLRIRASGLGITTLVERSGEIYIRPVVGSRLDEKRLRKKLGEGVRVTPNQVRLDLGRLSIDRLLAITTMLDEIEEVASLQLVR